MDADTLKLRVAERALDYVKPGMKLGLGTGSTAAKFIDLVGAHIAHGLDVICVPTSEGTRVQAEGLGIPLATLEELPELDLTVDGADEFDESLRLIKGGGGAHLREKIVAAASARLVVIADDSKRVTKLGAFPLPVEIVPFGWRTTWSKVGDCVRANGCKGSVTVRGSESDPFVTDNGNYILDCAFGVIDDPEQVATQLSLLPGVVEHGLFIGMTNAVIIAGANGVEMIGETA
jgi:ribose 5-phosphate isomerase A